MGIKSLLPFLRKKAPAAFGPVPWAEKPIRHVVVDMANYLMRVAHSTGDTTLDGLVSNVLLLHQYLGKHRVRKVSYVFDGERMLHKQNHEQQRRVAARQDEERRVATRRQQLDSLQQEEEALRLSAAQPQYTDVSQIPCDVLDALITEASETLNQEASEQPQPSLRRQIRELEEKIQRAEQRAAILLTHQTMRQVALELAVQFDRSCPPVSAAVIIAPADAEMYCAWLSQQQPCTAVASNDTDALVFGAPRVIFNVYSTKESCVELERVLHGLGLNMDRFRDMCILSGCDYAPYIPQMGPATAYKRIGTGVCTERLVQALPQGTAFTLEHLAVCRSIFQHQAIDAQSAVILLDQAMAETDSAAATASGRSMDTVATASGRSMDTAATASGRSMDTVATASGRVMMAGCTVLDAVLSCGLLDVE